MVDLSFLENFTKGDFKKMKRYIHIYLRTAPFTFKEMEKNIINQDWEQLRINAHSLKPQADYMGIAGLKDVLIEIEENVSEEKFEPLHQLYEKALTIHHRSITYLEEVF